MSNKRKMLSGGIANRTTATSELEPEKKNPSLYEPEQGKPSFEEHEKDEMLGALAEVDNARELQAKTVLLEQELAEAEQKLEEAEQEIEAVKQEATAIIEKAIVPTGDDSLRFRGLKMRAIGLDQESIPANMTEAELLEIVHNLRQVNEAIQWTVGDLINHACSRWGEKYSYYAKQTGYTEKTLREYAYIARSVHLSIRMDRLSFGHHQLVAGFKDKEGNPLTDTQQYWLSLAATGDNLDDSRVWSVARLRQAIIADKKANRASTRTHSDSGIHGSQMRDLAKLLTKDVSKLSEEERENYINHIGSLRRILNTVESKLKKSKQQVEA
jgi:hypothetical protein